MNYKKVLIGLAVVVGLIVIGFLMYQGWRNKLISLEEQTKMAWAQVETQLQRRLDLIPNLVETVKGYAAHEKETLISVTEARAKVAGASSVTDKIQANNELTSALSRLMVVVEKYPDLKANQNFLALQDELAGTENRVSVERRRYNEAAQQYNRTQKQFPYYIAAKRMALTTAPYFEAESGAKTAPKVKF